ncbi:MAG: hypothetical protein DI568_08930 [Sphingomonas sp.]|nr:MAG: hypothetical protein DI568_08930 [Sphingomonas sp.]
MTATTARAEFLKTEDRFAAAASPAMEARWGEAALDTSQVSSLVNEADALSEAARQLVQMGTPPANDVAVMAGIHRDLEGKTVTIPYGGRLGMPATANMLVIRARVNANVGTTTLIGIVLL